MVKDTSIMNYNVNYFGEGSGDIDSPAMRKLKNEIQKPSTKK